MDKATAYNWRDHWEEVSNCGEKILTVFRMETGELLSVSSGKRVCIHDKKGESLSSCLFSGAWRLRPKRTLRPWTAKEWGEKVGDWFLESSTQTRWQVVQVNAGGALEFKNEPFVNGVRTTMLSGVGTESFTNLDGSPCGTWEDAK